MPALYITATFARLYYQALNNVKMQKLNKFIAMLVFLGINQLYAQITILEETLLTPQSFDLFTPVSVTGTQTWTQSAQYGAVCSGFSAGQSYENEDWLVGPAMNLSQMDDAELTFSHTRGNAAVLNVGVQEGWYKAYATANYTGNPATTQWVELQGLNQNVPWAWQYISSGVLTIPAAAKSANSRIAFRYKSMDGQSATWEIKNVKITGRPQGTDVFKITNWNIEWLGCTSFGPTNESLQMSNAASAMLAMDSDIYCIQEISNTVANPTIQTLISLMGSDVWAGTIVPSNTGECTQRQAIIYKKARVQLTNSFQLNNGNGAQGNTYSFNWTNGRFPAVYNVNLLSGSMQVPVSLINIHGKAEDDEPMSYTRRKGASEALKTELDANYATKNVIVIGDFNDYLTGTTSDVCNCTASPYQNFMDDTARYNGITKNLINANTNWGGRPLIEHMIISDELNDNYVTASAGQEVSVLQTINNFNFTTSNHLPVTALFQFSTLNTPEFEQTGANAFSIYPNPVKDELKIGSIKEDVVFEIYDLAGRQIIAEKLNVNTVNVSSFPAGIYIIKIGSQSKKFVKE